MSESNSETKSHANESGDWWGERENRDARHAHNPEAGDYWHECFVPALVVLGVGRTTVTFCETIKNVPEDCWTWDLTKVSTLPRKEFTDRLRYHSESMRHKFWATCEPGAHKWASKAALEELFGA